MTTPSHSDRIHLRGLSVDCIIGFIEWERRVTQTLILDLELPVDCRRAARTDQIADTLDYRRVAARVTEFAAASQFHLIESLAQRIATLLLDELGVEWVRVTVKKRASVPHLQEAEVRIERMASDRGA